MHAHAFTPGPMSNPTLPQGRRDLPEELVEKHPSLQSPDTQLPSGTTTQRAGSSSSPEPFPRTSGALPPLPPITGDLGSAQRSPGRVDSSNTSTTTSTTTTTSGSTRLGPPSLARVSISQMSHEALDKTAHRGEAAAVCRFYAARPATACCHKTAGRLDSRALGTFDGPSSDCNATCRGEHASLIMLLFGVCVSRSAALFTKPMRILHSQPSLHP